MINYYIIDLKLVPFVCNTCSLLLCVYLCVNKLYIFLHRNNFPPNNAFFFVTVRVRVSGLIEGFKISFLLTFQTIKNLRQVFDVHCTKSKRGYLVLKGAILLVKNLQKNTMEPLNLILRFRLIFLAEFLF